jgi:hypothetical protein
LKRTFPYPSDVAKIPVCQAEKRGGFARSHISKPAEQGPEKE